MLYRLFDVAIVTLRQSRTAQDVLQHTFDIMDREELTLLALPNRISISSNYYPLSIKCTATFAISLHYLPRNKYAAIYIIYCLPVLFYGVPVSIRI